MNNLPDNPQPISPELQAKQHTQQLLSKLDELKKAYEPEKIQQIQTQLQVLGQEILSSGTKNDIIKQLHQQKLSICNEADEISRIGFQKTKNNITDATKNPSINNQQEVILNNLIAYRQDEITLKINLLNRIDTVSEARGFIINLPTGTQKN